MFIVCEATLGVKCFGGIRTALASRLAGLLEQGRRIGLRFAVALAAGVVALGPASAQEEPVALAVRDLTPFSLPFLAFVPAPPPPLGSRGWSLETRFSAANTFIHSGAVDRYLGERDGRSALSEAELASIAEFPTDDFYFDGEVESLTLESRWAVGSHHEVFISVPAVLLSGGALDAVIETFHDAFALGQANRDRVARDRFQLLLEVDGKTLLLAEAPTRGGLSDPVVGGRWRFGSSPGWNGTIEAAIKAPVAGERHLLSTGAWDAGVQVAVQRRWPVWGAAGSVSVVQTGRSRGALALPERTLPSLTVAGSRRLRGGTEAVAQITWTRSLFQGLVSSDLADPVWLGTLGVRHATGSLSWELGLVENLETYNNSADLGLHVSVAWRPRE